MGVRGIYSLLMKDMKSYTSLKTLPLLDESVRRKNRNVNVDEVAESTEYVRGHTELFVVDGNSFVYWFCFLVFGKEACCFTDYSELRTKLDAWLRSCYDHGLAFIFVFDGPTEPSKWITKLRRMQNQVTDICMNQEHKMQGTKNSSVPSIASILPMLGLQCIRSTLISHESIFGTNYVQSIEAPGEADKLIAYLASKNRATAILSNDTDMMCFHVYQNHKDISNTPFVLFSTFIVPPTGAPGGVNITLIEPDKFARRIGIRAKVFELLILRLDHVNSFYRTLGCWLLSSATIGPPQACMSLRINDYTYKCKADGQLLIHQYLRRGFRLSDCISR